MSYSKTLTIRCCIAALMIWSCSLHAENDATADLLREAEAILSNQKQDITEAEEVVETGVTELESEQQDVEQLSPVTNDTEDDETASDTDTTPTLSESTEETVSELADKAVIMLDESSKNAVTLDDSAPDMDIVLVLDNSGSMKQNDPQFLASSAVREFISSMEASTRISVVIFDQSVRVAVPFTEATESDKASLLASVDEINYKGLFTDSPAAIERAIYDLKDQGREDANKLIIFMTDGIVDTGKPDMDVEKTRWLKDDLAADAADNDIQIFAIAFTEAADFQLIQSLAQKTDGEYYRALTPEDLPRVFEKIHAIINTPDEPEVIPPPIVVQPPPPPVVQEVLPPPPPPEPVFIEVPVQVENEDAKMRSTILIIAVSVMIIALIAILILLMRRNKSSSNAQEAPVHEAFINDIHGLTDKGTYKLGSRPVMIGRVAGKDTDHLDYIVIPQTTIGRRHALIEYKEFAYWIVDQGSINGTFVNDKAITAETRLKHGDRIRLHKFELEFSVPEMADDGMTVISNTVFAGMPDAPASQEDDKTVARAATPPEENKPDSEEKTDAPDFELEFDITSGLVEEDEDETVLRVDEADITESPIQDEEPVEENDETILIDDETLVPEDEEATLRRKLDDIQPEKFVETEEINLNDIKKD